MCNGAEIMPQNGPRWSEAGSSLLRVAASGPDDRANDQSARDGGYGVYGPVGGVARAHGHEQLVEFVGDAVCACRSDRRERRAIQRQMPSQGVGQSAAEQEEFGEVPDRGYVDGVSEQGKRCGCQPILHHGDDARIRVERGAVFGAHEEDHGGYGSHGRPRQDSGNST